MLCNGEACDYSPLLNSEGKLGNNWVRLSTLVAWLGLDLGKLSSSWVRLSMYSYAWLKGPPHSRPHALRCDRALTLSQTLALTLSPYPSPGARGAAVGGAEPQLAL